MGASDLWWFSIEGNERHFIFVRIIFVLLKKSSCSLLSLQTRVQACVSKAAGTRRVEQLCAAFEISCPPLRLHGPGCVHMRTHARRQEGFLYQKRLSSVL